MATNVFPIFPSRLSVGYRMNMPCRDQKIENPKESAIRVVFEGDEQKSMIWKAYLDVMHTIILENFLLRKLGFCL